MPLFNTVLLWVAGTVIVVLSPLILLHELGHFIFAKLAGVRVEEFGFGFPPRLARLWTGEGYLDVGGQRLRIPRNFRLPPNLGAGMRVQAIARRNDDGTYTLRRLEVLTSESRPWLTGDDPSEVPVSGEVTTLEKGTIYSLNWIPLGAFVKMTGEEDPSDPRSLAAQPKRWRFAAIAAGPVFNLIAAVLLIAAAYGSGLPEKWWVEVTDVEAGSAAAEAGLRPGDIITAVDGLPLDDGAAQLRQLVRAAPERTLELTIRREGRTLTVTAVPARTGEGYGLLGIYMSDWPDRGAMRHYSPVEAFRAGLDDLIEVTLVTIGLPVEIAQGNVSIEAARPASPIGISEMLALTLKRSLEWHLAYPILNLAAIVSLALGLTNLLPLPALDGGRLLFIFIEAVRGKRVSPKHEAAIHLIGMGFLIGLSLFIMLLDIFDPILPWSLFR